MVFFASAVCRRWILWDCRLQVDGAFIESSSALLRDVSSTCPGRFLQLQRDEEKPTKSSDIWEK